MADSSIQVLIQADASGLESGASQAADSAAQISENLQSIKEAADAGSAGLQAAAESISSSFEGMKQSAVGLLELFGAFKAVEWGKNLVSESLDLGEAFWRQAQITGINVVELERLKFAAEATGTSFQMVIRAVEMSARVLQQLQQAGGGSATIKTSMKGLSLTEADFGNTDVLLQKVADGLKLMDERGASAAEKLSVLRGVFGRMGGELEPFFNNLTRLKAEFDAFGVTLDAKAIAKLTETKERFNELGTIWELVKGQLTADLTPALDIFAKLLFGVVKEIDEFATSEGAQNFGKNIALGILQLVDDINSALLPALNDAKGAFTDIAAIAHVVAHPMDSMLDGINAVGDLMTGLGPDTTAALVTPPEKAKPAFQELADIVAKLRADIQAGVNENTLKDLAGSTGGGGLPPNAVDTKAQEAAYKMLGEAALESEQAQVAALGDFQRELKATTTSNIAVETSAAKTVETMYAADFALQRAQIEELSKTHVITAQQAAAQLTALDQRELASKLTTINAEITALQTYAMAEVGTAEKIAALKAQAYALTQAAAVKEVTDQTKAAQETQQVWTEAFSVIGDNMSKVLDIMVTGSSSKTNTMKMQFMNLAQSIEKEMLSSGLKQILMGGGPIIGTKGMLGGIGGEIASAFSGSAVGAGLKNAMTTAWTGMTGIVGQVFGGAFRGIAGILHSVFGAAVQGAASAGAGAAASTGASAAAGAASAAGGAAQTAVEGIILSTMAAGFVVTDSILSTIGIALGTMTIMLTDMAMVADQSLVELIMINAGTWGSVHPFGFSGGGIVPSASGGMVVPGGGSFAIVHPQEMILPAHLSKGVQNAINGGSFGGGGGGGNPIIVNFNISALDGNSAHQVIMRHSDSIAQAVAKGVRGGKMTGQGVYRGNFRR